VFVKAYQVIVGGRINVVSEDGDFTARGLGASITKWDFIIAAVTLQHIFRYTHILHLDQAEASKQSIGLHTRIRVQ